MKKYLSLLLCATLCSSVLYAVTPLQQSAPSAVANDNALHELRAQLTEQTLQTKAIIATLCDIIATSKDIPNNTELCRELTLLGDFMSHICSVINIMDADELGRLVEINHLLLTQLQEQIATGDLSKLSNFDPSQFALLQQRSCDTESLQQHLTALRNKVAEVWSLVTPLSLVAATAQPAPSLWQNMVSGINNNSGYLALAGVLLAIDSSIRLAQKQGFNSQELAGKIIYKSCIYSLAALYLLRQKKDKDIAELAQSWFGKNSTMGNAMLTLKDWVGSPKNKKPAVHIVVRDDMSAQEQVAWAKAQDCDVIELDRGRNSSFLRNFFEFEDGVIRLPLYILFTVEVKKDVEYLARQAGGLPAAIVNYLFPQKNEVKEAAHASSNSWWG